MIDFILLCFVVGVFAAGFWCGKTFVTPLAMWTRAKTSVKSWLA